MYIKLPTTEMVLGVINDEGHTLLSVVFCVKILILLIVPVGSNFIDIHWTIDNKI